MRKRLILALLIVAVIIPISSSAYDDTAAQRVECLDSLSPEICNQYDPEVLAGERPSFWYPDEDDIFSLRECESRGTDFINTDDPPSVGQLSTAQIEALELWVSDCSARIYLTGGSADDYVELLFGMATDEESTFSDGRLELGTPVSTGVEEIEFFCLRTGITSPLSASIEPIVIATDSNRNPCLFTFLFGSSQIFYDGITGSIRGRDEVRFILNLRQCLIGSPIPESTAPSNCNHEFSEDIVLETLELNARDPDPSYFSTELVPRQWYKLLIFSNAKVSASEQIPSQAHFRVLNGSYGKFSFLNSARLPIMREEIFIDAEHPVLGIHFLDSPDSYTDNSGTITVHLLRVIPSE